MTLWKQGPRQRPWQKPIEDDPVQIAVAGIGAFAREWILPGFEQTDYCECPVVVSGRPHPELAETYDVLTYNEFDAGVSAHQYDAVYVTTPNDRHLDIATTAAELGKDVLCEKPIEATLSRARRLVDVCAEQDVTLMTGNRVQFKPTIRYVRRLIDRGVIGTPVHVHSSSSFDVLSQGGTDQWRLDPERGGGALLDIGVYPINTIRYLLDTDLSPMFARSHHAPEIDDVEAHSEFHLSLDNGGRAVCTISFAAQPESHLRLVGRERTVHIESAFRPVYEPTVYISDGQQQRSVTRDQRNEYVAQLEYFSQCLLRDETPASDGRQGVADVEVIDKLHRLSSSQSPK